MHLVILFSTIISAFTTVPVFADTKLYKSSLKQQSSNYKSKKPFYNRLSHRYLTRNQETLLRKAYQIGFRDGDEEHALLLQALMMQESHAGNYGRIGDTDAQVGKRSYGIMQIKLTVAHDVLERHPELGTFQTEEELIVRLMTDDLFSLHLASKHLKHLRKHAEYDAQAVLAYNRGLRGARDNWYPEKQRYVKMIQRYLTHVVQPFNRYYGKSQHVVALND